MRDTRTRDGITYTYIRTFKDENLANKMAALAKSDGCKVYVERTPDRYYHLWVALNIFDKIRLGLMDIADNKFSTRLGVP
jgi:hypothetical protein